MTVGISVNTRRVHASTTIIAATPDPPLQAAFVEATVDVRQAKPCAPRILPCRQESVPLVGHLTNANFARYERTRLPMLIMFLELPGERPYFRGRCRLSHQL